MSTLDIFRLNAAFLHIPLKLIRDDKIWKPSVPHSLSHFMLSMVSTFCRFVAILRFLVHVFGTPRSSDWLGDSKTSMASTGLLAFFVEVVISEILLREYGLFVIIFFYFLSALIRNFQSGRYPVLVFGITRSVYSHWVLWLRVGWDISFCVIACFHR